MKFLLKTCFLLIMGLGLYAQDYHFSQFYASPQTMNPALTGVFNGNYRLNAIYRGQWFNIDQGLPPVYRTLSASADIRTNQGFDKNDAMGFGLVLLGDQAGPFNYGTNLAGLNFSYSKALDYRASNYLTIGGGFNVTNRGIKYNDVLAQWGDEFEGAPTQDYILDDNFYFYDLSAGLLWYTKFMERSSVYLGGSVYHINRPRESLRLDADVRLPMKFTVHAGLSQPLISQVDIEPKAILLFQGKNWESNFGTDVRLYFDRRDPEGDAFYVGVMSRIVGGDPTVLRDEAINFASIILTSRVEYQGFNIGVAYDINISEFVAATRTKGAFELSLGYQGFFKQRRPKTLSCPRF